MICSVGDCGKQTHAHGMCKTHAHTMWRRSIADKRPACDVPGCDKPAKGMSGACVMHYMRMIRTGTYEPRSKIGRHATQHGYVLVNRPDHPMATAKDGKWGYEHRVVLYDAIGPGWHSCNWCGRMVTWDKTYAKDDASEALVVDHVDGNKANNDLANLVASCQLCNVRRSWETRRAS